MSVPLPAPFAPPPWPTPGGFFASGLRIAGPAGFTGGELEGAGSAVLGAGAGLLAAGLGLAFAGAAAGTAPAGLAGAGSGLAVPDSAFFFAASASSFLRFASSTARRRAWIRLTSDWRSAGTARLALVRRSR